MSTTAEEIMTTPAASIDVSASVAQALEALAELQVRHLPVLRDGELVGMVSDRDLRAVVPTTASDFEKLEMAQSRFSQPITSFMSGDVLSVGPQTDLAEVIDLMLEEKVGAIPVLDEEEGELVGIVSYVDVLRALRPEAA